MKKTLLFVIGFPCFVLNCVYQTISALHIILCGPREHMIVLQKKKKLCYFISYIMKVRINTTSFCFYLPFCLYAEIDFGVRMIRNGFSIDDDCVDGSKE